MTDENNTDTTHEDNILQNFDSNSTSGENIKDVALRVEPGTRFHPVVKYDTQRVMRCVAALPPDEVQYLMQHLDERTVQILNKIIPGLPFIVYLRNQSKLGLFEHPTVDTFRTFRDLLRAGEIQFPWGDDDTSEEEQALSDLEKELLG